MNFNEKHFDAALDKLKQRRDMNAAIEQHRHDEVCERIPQYAELEKKLSETSAQLIKLMLTEKKDSATRLLELENNNLAIQHSMNDLLKGAGYAEDYLEPVYSCRICKDKGTVNGGWCKCIDDLMLKLATEELNEVSPLRLSSFDTFNLGYYSDEKDASIGISHREIMAKNLEYCRNYARDFTRNSGGIFMSGGTGLGKTHLSLAIAETVIGKGFSVVYTSVPEILRELERQHFGRDPRDSMDTLSKCDLLILDDLGAEVEKPLYTSLLYEVINSRICRSLPLIISSNCGPNELKERYQDRIWSRIFSFEVLVFVGSDVRRKLKK